MATITIGRAYFDALLQRARFYNTGQEPEFAPDLLNNVTVSRSEYNFLQQCSQEYTLLKNALFRGGFTIDALKTLLLGESEASNHDNIQHERVLEETVLVNVAAPSTPQKFANNKFSTEKHYKNGSTSPSDDTDTTSDYPDLAQPRPLHGACSNDQTEFYVGRCLEDEQECLPEKGHRQRIPVHDQRTILISNIAERTTHKDIAGIIRGGRLLDIFFRSDRSVTVSFVEGAAEFLAYVKRNDIYLHAKRLDFRWADRQFNVPPRIANKIVEGVTRNLIVRGVAGRVTEELIRDHLDHIHNLVVVDVYFRNKDAHISINSIHNALSARACMMSRTIYKGTRIDWGPDNCAAPLPQPGLKARPSVMRIPEVPLPTTNTYAILDMGSDVDTDSQNESHKPAGTLSRGRYLS